MGHVGGVQVVASKKDFIRIEWSPTENDMMTSGDPDSSAMWTTPNIRGYRIRYQAVGSSYVHESVVVPPEVRYYDIHSLHENTMYDICVRTQYNAVSSL